jgi:hypothetical protein
VSGRLEQLARQIRRLRTSASEPARTLQRALHLAADLAAEQLEDGTFTTLAAKGIIDAGVAERLAKLADRERVGPQDLSDAVLVDLDVFLRSLELGAPAPPAELPPLGTSPKLPPGTQRASVNISGRVVTVVGRDGRAFVLIDDRPVGQPFDLVTIPMSAPTVDRTRDGTAHIRWQDAITLELAPDFGSVRVALA